MKNKFERFKLNAEKIHGNKYDYSKVIYNNVKSKVNIICPKHGEFEQTPHHHITRKQGCPNCRYENVSRLTRGNINEFIIKANKIHENKYGYSLVDYINRKTKVKIICPIHGEFEQTPDNHLNGQTCGKCNGLNKTNNEFIVKANKIHQYKYNYSLVEYINRKTKIKIICPIHGEFKQLPYAHENGHGCPKCFGLNKTNDNFIFEAKLIHGNKYDYSLVNYITSKTKIKIVCPIHGEFEQTPNMHLRNNGCPSCNESKGEKEIRKFLNINNIKFIPQYTFKNCKNKQTLPFDFYLSEFNTCIEYDGKQHFIPIKHWGGDDAFVIRQKRDKIKNEYCIKNNITLFRIRYDDNINNKLLELIKTFN